MLAWQPQSGAAPLMEDDGVSRIHGEKLAGEEENTFPHVSCDHLLVCRSSHGSSANRWEWLFQEYLQWGLLPLGHDGILAPESSGPKHSGGLLGSELFLCHPQSRDMVSASSRVYVFHLLRAVGSYHPCVRNIFPPWKLIKIHVVISMPAGSCRILLSCLYLFLLMDISFSSYTRSQIELVNLYRRLMYMPK